MSVNIRKGIIASALILLLFLTIPSACGFRTLASCGDGSSYSDFKEGVDNSARYLDDEWNWATSGRSIARGHYTDKAIDEDEYLKSFYNYQSSQIHVCIAHGGSSGSGTISLYGSDWLYGSTFDTDMGDGNFGKGVPGNVYFCGSCHLGATGKLAQKARNAGCRYVVGFPCTVKVKFVTANAKQFSRYCADDSKYTHDQIWDKAYYQAKRDTWYYRYTCGYPSTRVYYHSGSGSTGATEDHKPRTEYDFDKYPTGGYVYKNNNLVTVGNAKSVVSNDDGAIFFFNSIVENDNDRVKVEYQKYSGGSWITKGTYNLKDPCKVNGVDCCSENIVIKFSDADVYNSYFKVRITPLDGKVLIYNCRIHILAE